MQMQRCEIVIPLYLNSHMTHLRCFKRSLYTPGNQCRYGMYVPTPTASTGTLLFYARVIDNTMHVAQGTLTAAQTQGPVHTIDSAIQLRNYAATHPDAVVRFHKCDMRRHIHCDASYLSEPQYRSRVGGYFYSGKVTEPPDIQHSNRPIHMKCRIMKYIMAAASEAEIGVLCHNGQQRAYTRQILKELDREQPEPTRMNTDNSTADGFANIWTKIPRSKAMDMRFHWVQDRVQNGEFAIDWPKGEQNLAGYFTKHHPLPTTSN
jgi:hypothetical protein